MFEFVKSLNNNIVLAYDENHNEVVLFGTGIGFNRKKGDMVEESSVTKLFINDSNKRLAPMIQNLSEDIVSATEEIVQYGSRVLEKQLHASILIVLADHLYFAMERAKKSQNVDNPLQWEVPHLYPKEYEIGVKGVKSIEERLQIKLPPQEASFIALHFVNAQFESQDMSDTLKITEIISRILDIVNYHFQLILDENSLYYSRFIVHLRYFIIRQKTHMKDTIGLNDEDLLETVKTRYKKSYQCAVKIAKYLHDAYSWDVSKDEIIYLLLHIERITSVTKK
ncbi:BglG family transcription antiterminator LicT [Lacrimispora indolis]|uniref:BglG family transcription antiterminator LicT n=1 Tax=Lacrimispora indolis TaxID=69825 RepID=UPI00041A8E23|nr:MULTISPECIES: PRD domain-containing protein [Lachnospiraceae]MBE7722334.1 PRD domain-containing protein [Lacrimispora celerecrescens]